MYGCETWNWNAKQMRKMEGIQYRFLRTVCGKTWQDKVSYVELLKLTTADARNNNFDWENTSNKGVSITSVILSVGLPDSDMLDKLLVWLQQEF